MLDLTGISRRFGATHALEDVSLALSEGEVLGLVGPNGAGKSTLIKIIAGADQPDAGEIRIDGTPVHFHSAHDAYAAGIRVIHQDAPLVPGFDTVENCYLGRAYPRRFGRIDRGAMRAAIAEVAADIAPGLDLDIPVMFLPPAERQFVRLLRAIADKGRLLILDEPTAALPAEDAERFYEVLRRTRERGTSIILVSHRLDEIADFCGRAVVLRDGRIVARFGKGEVKPEAMIAAMGGSVSEPSTRATDTGAPLIIEIDGVTGGDLTRPAQLGVYAGEVMALYGLAGSGRSSLLNAIWGAIPWRGTMRLAGEAYRPRSPRGAIGHGVSYVPADRHRSGLFVVEDLIFNKTLPLLSSYRRMRGLPVPDQAAEREQFLVAAGQVSLSYRDPKQLARTLSGGNQQKLMFSRWANRHSRVMLLDEPTEGVDVMAKSTIKGIIRAIAADGNAVLVSTSDRDEALELGDRIAVFRQGGIVKVFSRAAASAEALSAAAQSREAA